MQLPEFECDPVDNCLSSVLGQEVELTDEFKRNYEKWLHNEVCHYSISTVVRYKALPRLCEIG